MKTLSTYKRSLWRYIFLALWLCGTLTTWGQTVLERGDVASSMNTLKKKVLYIFSLLFISTFLYAQIPNPINIKWEFPEKPFTNPTSFEGDQAWFSSSFNSYPNIFSPKQAGFGSGINSSGLTSGGFGNACVSYDGILNGYDGSCSTTNYISDYSIGARGWTNENFRDINDYIKVELDLNNLDCYNFENTHVRLQFHTRRSSSGPKKLSVHAYANGEALNFLSNLLDISLNNNNNWQSHDLDLSLILQSAHIGLLNYIQTHGLNTLEIRFYGYRASNESGTLRLDNIDLEFQNIEQSEGILNLVFDDDSVCLGETYEFPDTQGISGTWSPASINTTTPGPYTYTFTPSDACYSEASFNLTVVPVPDRAYIIGLSNSQSNQGQQPFQLRQSYEICGENLFDLPLLELQALLAHFDLVLTSPTGVEIDLTDEYTDWDGILNLIAQMQSFVEEGVWQVQVFHEDDNPALPYSGSTCIWTGSLELIIHSSPDPGIISGDTEVCVGQSINLSSTVSGGIWSSNDEAIATVDSNTGEVTGVAAGEVEISYTVGSDNLCPDSSESITITVNPVPITSPIEILP